MAKSRPPHAFDDAFENSEEEEGMFEAHRQLEEDMARACLKKEKKEAACVVHV